MQKLLISTILTLTFSCGSAKMVLKEIPQSAQAREAAARTDLFVEAKLKKMNMQEQDKQEVVQEFGNCAEGLRSCAVSLEEATAKLDHAEKDLLKLKVIKNRILTALIILSVLVVLTIIIRVLVFVYVRK